MTQSICPKGHSSSESDFCSECGAKIQGADAPAPLPNVALHCPDCAAPAPIDGSAFCEICGYNFITKVHGQIPVPDPPPTAVNPVAPDPIPPPAPGPEPLSCELLVTVDPSLREPASPEAPQNVGPFTFALDKPVNLIGRRSETRAIFPEIPLDFDAAVSHRHALISKNPDSSLVLRDIGSSNGTRLNGKDVQPMVDLSLQAGDEVTLGHWTRLLVKAT